MATNKKPYLPPRAIRCSLEPPAGWHWERSSNGFHLRHTESGQLTWHADKPSICLVYAAQWEQWWAKQGTVCYQEELALV